MNLMLTLMTKSLEEISQERDRLIARGRVIQNLKDSGQAPIENSVVHELNQLINIYSVALSLAAAAETSGVTKH